MKTTIKKLVLENFRGITGTFELNPGRNVFSGPNGSGKTSIFDSESFCRIGKDSQGSAKFAIKTIKDGVTLTEIDHSVFITYDIDGKPLELGRVYAEKYTGKRGGNRTKSGNETTYFVDQLEVKQKEYNAKIMEVFTERFSICSDIRELAEMDWKKRREILFPMAGDVDQEKVIDSIPELRELMGTRTIEDGKKAADQRSRKIIEEIADIPGKIAEHKTILENAGGITAQMADKAISESENAIGKAQIAIDGFNQVDNSEVIEDLRKLNAELLKAETEFQSEKSGAQKIENARLNDIVSVVAGIKNHEENLKEHQEAIGSLRKNYAGIKSTTPESVGNVCHECGQSLPAEKIQELTDNFNHNKSEALAENQRQGGEMAKEIGLIELALKSKQDEKESLEKIEPGKPISDADVIGLQSKIKILKSEMDSKSEEIPAELIQTLGAAKIRLTQAQEQKALIKTVAGSQTRIDELKTKKSELSTENDKVEKFLSLYDKFNQAMADSTEAPINAMFQNVNFRMFKTQEDGKIVPCCDVLDKEMRPYQGALSNGERIQAGLDIIRTMQKHFNIQAPVWIDNSESVTGEIELDCQLIELKANLQYETLTKEV